MKQSTSNKSCWTCKDRKIACDKQLPSCHKCRSSGRECLGYGMRLSWPRKDDRKRAIIAKDSCRSQELSPLWFLQADFVNVFSSDVKLSHGMLHLVLSQKRTSPLPRLYPNLCWTPSFLNRSESDLFSYYLSNVTHMRTIANNPQVQNLVLRMIFTDQSLASAAILFAICALSSLHLSNGAQALEYKSRAVNAVCALTAQPSKDVLQRIVAVNFLAIFDAFGSTMASKDWATRICYAKTAAIATFAPDQCYQGDLALILDWVYYYDVLSRFSVAHYDRRTEGVLICAKRKHIMFAEMNSPDQTHVVPTLACSLEVLSAISCIIDTILESETDDDPRTEILDKLERRLKFAQQDIRVEVLDNPQSTEKVQRIRDIAELYRLGGLIYLYRAGRKASVSNQTLQPLVEKAFHILETLEVCERALPFFIVSCEARTDLQRATVLRIIKATQAHFSSPCIFHVHEYIEGFWAQDDLDTGQEIDYALKMTSVLSNTDGLPVFL